MFVLFATAPYFANGYLDPQQKGLPPSDPQLESGGVGASYSISYTYDGGVLSRITYPSSLTVAYTHDGLGRISEVSKLGTSTIYARSPTTRTTRLRQSRMETTWFEPMVMTLSHGQAP